MKVVKKLKFWQQIGVSLVSIGLGIGSGEFILWPYLTANHGFAILWGALFGICLQIFLNIEIQRYAFVKRESLVKGAFALSKYLGIWFIFSTIVGFGWPGFASSSALLTSQLLGLNGGYSVLISVLVLLLAGSILALGKNVYQRIEKILKILIPFSFIIILIIFIHYFNIDIFKDLISGLFGVGGITASLSDNLSLPVFFGAIVYAGSGGNLLLSQSYFILEKENFDKDFARNRKFHIFENIVIFGGMGLLTILMLSYLGFVLTKGMEGLSNDLSFLAIQSNQIELGMGLLFSKLYLFAGAVALFSVQLGVLDLLGRITTQVVSLWKGNGNINFQSYKFSILFLVVIGEAILLFGISQPLWLLVMGSVFNALAMSVIAILTLILNRKLEKEKRPNILTNILLFLISLFYLVFFVVSIQSVI